MADAAAIQFTRDQDSLVSLLAKIPTTPDESVVHIAGALPLKHLFFAPIDHEGRRMSELHRALSGSGRSLRERLEALAPGQDWSRMSSSGSLLLVAWLSCSVVVRYVADVHEHHGS